MKIFNAGSSGKIFHLTGTLLRVEFNILKNKTLLSENRVIGITFSVLILLSLLALRHKYINEDHSLIFLITNLIPVLTPVYLARLYLIKSVNKYSFLKSFKSGTEIMRVKQIISLIISLSVFVILIFFGFRPLLKSEISNFIIFIELILLITVSVNMPLLIRERNTKKNQIVLSELWKIRLSSTGSLPVRAVVFRDLLYLIRTNISSVFSFLTFAFISNAFIILFVINNSYSGGFLWGLIIQLLYIFSRILDYSSDNNIDLLKANNNYVYDILKGEFFSWSILLFVYLTALIILYNSIKPEFNMLHYILMISLSMIILAYALLIRITFIYNGILRNIVFAAGLFPLFFAIVLFFCIRRIKCWS